jgi:hypothetical protein
MPDSARRGCPVCGESRASAREDLAHFGGSAYLVCVDPFGFGFTVGVRPNAGPCLPIQSSSDPPREVRRPYTKWSSR